MEVAQVSATAVVLWSAIAALLGYGLGFWHRSGRVNEYYERSQRYSAHIEEIKKQRDDETARAKTEREKRLKLLRANDLYICEASGAIEKLDRLLTKHGVDFP